MTWRAWRVLVACLVAALGVAAISIVYTAHTAQEATRRLCEIVAAQDDIYQEIPPVTPAGRELAAAVAQLRRDFDCPN